MLRSLPIGAAIAFEFAAHALPFREKMTETKITRGADMTIGSKNKLPVSQKVKAQAFFAIFRN